MAIHEAAADMLRPTETVELSDLGAVAQVAAEAQWKELDKVAAYGFADDTMLDFFERLQAAADALVKAADDTVETKKLSNPKPINPGSSASSVI